ncbi:MAG: SprB repeat-containing protein, partial [Bacteroidota bacterium]
MNKTILTLLLLVLAMSKTPAQQLFCWPPGDGPETAPIIDCLNGYSFETALNGGTTPIPGFCGEIDNSQWIAFVATEGFLHVQLDVGNCMNNQGLQLAVYGMAEPCDHFNLFPVSGCFSDLNGLPNTPIVTATNLQIGHVYYIMIDGFNGDLCEYTINIIPDLDYPDPPEPFLSGPSTVATGTTATYQLEYPPRDTSFIVHNPCDNVFAPCCLLPCQMYPEYYWTAPAGTTIDAMGTQADITWGEEGGEVCLEVRVCSNSTFYCMTVDVLQLGEPCTGPDTLIVPSDSCHTTPLFCGFLMNGTCQNNGGATAEQPGDLASQLSCSIENNEYFKFTADSGAVKILIETNNCVNAEGLEVSVFTTDDCENYYIVRNCQLLADGSLDSLEFTNNVDCQEFYLMFDGVNGDACDYRLLIQSGISTEPYMIEEISPGCIEGPDTLCIGALAQYRFIPPECIVTGGGSCSNTGDPIVSGTRPCYDTYFIWRVPAGIKILGDSINVYSIDIEVVDTAVSGPIYIEYVSEPNGDTCNVYLVCNDYALGGCTIKPKFINIIYDLIVLPDVILCEGDCYEFCGVLYCQSTRATCRIPCGWEIQPIIVLPDEFFFYDVELCPGECTNFFGQQICSGGYYTQYIPCEGWHELIVTEIDLIYLSGSSIDVSCNGESDGSLFVTASGGLPPLTYDMGGWGSSSGSFSGLPAGSYEVWVTDAAGCSSSINLFINEPSPTELSLEWTTDVSCYGESDGSISVNGRGGTAPYTYHIVNNWGSFGPTFNGLTAGTYEVVLTDNNGCKNSIEVEIDQPEELLVTTDTRNASCGTSNGAASAAATGGVPPYTYYWSNGSMGSNITGLGPDYYGLTVTDDNGCTASDENWVYPLPGPQAQASVTAVNCPGGSDGTIKVDVTSGLPPYSFQWSNAALNGTSEPSGLSAGNYQVTVTDADDCSVSLDVTVAQPTAYEEVTITERICDGTAFNIGGQSLMASGNYTIPLTSSRGCDSVVLVILVVEPNYEETLFEQICQGDQFSVAGQNYSTTGTYTNTLTASSECDSTVTLYLDVVQQVNQTLNEQICQGDQFTIAGQNYSTTGVYTNTLTASSGCDSVITLNLDVTQPISQTLNEQICQGDQFSVAGQSYSSSGTYTNTLTASSGCDSVVTLNLDVT